MARRSIRRTAIVAARALVLFLSVGASLPALGEAASTHCGVTAGAGDGMAGMHYSVGQSTAPSIAATPAPRDCPHCPPSDCAGNVSCGNSPVAVPAADRAPVRHRIGSMQPSSVDTAIRSTVSLPPTPPPQSLL